MKAILIKRLPATDTKPTRMKAIADGVPSITRSFASLEGGWGRDEEAAAMLASQMCNQHAWPGTLAAGQLASGDWVFCFVETGYHANVYDALGNGKKAVTKIEQTA